MRIVQRTQYHATFTGRSEFYSGIRNGERVLLTVETGIYWDENGLRVEGDGIVDARQRSRSSLSVQRIDGNSAHLGVRLNEVTDLEPLPEAVPALHAQIREALEGDSNDAEHDALAAVAEALGISYTPSYS